MLRHIRKWLLRKELFAISRDIRELSRKVCMRNDLYSTHVILFELADNILLEGRKPEDILNAAKVGPMLHPPRALTVIKGEKQP